MILYCFGDDSYRRLEKIRELVSRYEARNPAHDECTLDFGEEPERLGEALDFLRQSTLFGGKKLAVVFHGAQIADARWAGELKRLLADRDIFVLIADDRKPVRKLAFLLRPPVKSWRFDELQEEELDPFIHLLTKRFNVTLSPDARAFLHAYAAAHTERSWRLRQEIERASLLPGPVDKAALSRLNPWRREGAFYAAVLAFLRAREPGARLTLLEQLFGRHEDAEYVFNMLGALVSGEASKKLAAYDVYRKSGKLDTEEALLGFALGVSL